MQIRHDPEQHRFVAENGGELGVLDYAELADGALEYRRTFVPPEHRGEGVAGRLVRHALDWALENGRRVVPTCWYVAQVIERHPEAYEGITLERG